MRRLNRFAVPGRRDRGAAALIVTVLVSCGVILGMLAISADIGSVTSQRRSVQNSSDAAVMALAYACAKNNTAICSSAGAPSSLASLVSANSNGATVQSVCVSKLGAITGDPITTLCPTGNTADLGACLPAPSWASSGPYVEVRTLNTANTPFGGAMGASSSRPVPACARGSWGPAGGTGYTLPIVASPCEWSAGTNGGKNFAPSPSYSTAPGTPSSHPNTLPNIPVEIDAPAKTPPTHFATMIGAHADVGDCTDSSNGMTYPGGFSWVQTVSGCSAVFDATGTILVGSNGASVPSGCSGNITPYLGTEVYVPIGVSLNSGTYTIDGVASFYLAGYDNLPSGVPNSQAVYNEPSYVCSGKCNGSQQYLWGWFTSSVKPISSVTGLGGTPRGGNQVTPAG